MTSASSLPMWIRRTGACAVRSRVKAAAGVPVEVAVGFGLDEEFVLVLFAVVVGLSAGVFAVHMAWEIVKSYCVSMWRACVRQKG